MFLLIPGGSALRHGWFFEIIGKIMYAGLDCEGNIHIVLKKESGFWRDIAIKFLEGEENHIVKLRIMPWDHKRVNAGFKRPRKSTIAVRNSET